MSNPVRLLHKAVSSRRREDFLLPLTLYYIFSSHAIKQSRKSKVNASNNLLVVLLPQVIIGTQTFGEQSANFDSRYGNCHSKDSKLLQHNDVFEPHLCSTALPWGCIHLTFDGEFYVELEFVSLTWRKTSRTFGVLDRLVQPMREEPLAERPEIFDFGRLQRVPWNLVYKPRPGW